jgi:hypothetical protein
MKGVIMNMNKHYKKMNKYELIKTLEILDDMQEDLRQIYEEEFGDKIGEPITDEVEVELYLQIENNLSKIILARNCIKERLRLEFNTFIM